MIIYRKFDNPKADAMETTENKKKKKKKKKKYDKKQLKLVLLGRKKLGIVSQPRYNLPKQPFEENRGNALVGARTTEEGGIISPELLQRLKKDFNRYHRDSYLANSGDLFTQK
jgi:hypothetical protein